MSTSPDDAYDASIRDETNTPELRLKPGVLSRARACVEQIEAWNGIAQSGEIDNIEERAEAMNEMAWNHTEPLIVSIMAVLTHDNVVRLLQGLIDTEYLLRERGRPGWENEVSKVEGLHQDLTALIIGEEHDNDEAS